MFMESVIKEYIYEIKIKNYTQRTISEKNYMLKRFNMYLESELKIIELEEVHLGCIKSYIKHLKSRDLTSSYINSILKTVKAFFVYCEKENYCVNISNRIKLLKEPKVVIQTFTDNEVKRLLNYYNTTTFLQIRNKAVLYMLFDTGIRNSELCNLKMTDIRETTIFIFGKGRKERVVPISPKLKKMLIKYERARENYIRDSFKSCDNYFISRNHRALTTGAVQNILKIARDECKIRKTIRCSPHTCRHYFAQAQLRNGLDVYSLSRLLGHEDISITKRYLQGLQDEKIIEMGIETSPLMNLK